ncbi:MAG TPA: ATP-binding protein [Nitriliruptorales bacterium]|nr:ATP-binding protein [Nitriliruptorales bacterium]
MTRLGMYVLGWAGAALVTLTSFLLAGPQDPAPDVAGGWQWTLALALATALAELVDLRLHHRDTEEAITLSEAAIVVAILTLPPPSSVVAVVGGLALAHLAKRAAPVKLVFNLSQYTAATVAAVTVFHGARGGAAALSGRGLVAAAIALAAFGTVNAFGIGGVVAILERRPLGAVLREGAPLATMNVLGNVAVGILAAVLWHDRPALAGLLLVPAAILHLAERGVVRSRALLLEVAAERDRLDRVVMGASDGIMLLDPDGTVQVWSPAMERLTGVPASAAMQHNAAEVLTGVDADGEPVDPSQPLATADPAEPLTVVEMALRHRRGGERIVVARHTLLFDEHDRCTGDVVLFHDVTRERETARMQDDFVSRVSHELRTPLTPIKGFAQSLLRHFEAMEPQARRRALEQIVDRADHMTRLIDDILLVGQMSSQRAAVVGHLHAIPTDLAAVVERVVDSFRVAHKDRVFKVETAAELPAAHADPARVEQIVGNLLSNACTYSQHGRPVRVTVTGSSLTGVEVTVIDHGRGIAAENLERVFDRFYRVEDPMVMETGGLGLGLFIAREFAEAMDGSITVSSRPGEGSAFTLRLPVAGEAPASTTPTVSEGGRFAAGTRRH